MAEESAEATPKTEEVEAPKPSEQKIMCFVSKEMVPLSSTVEVEYSHGKKVRVLPRYVKFDTAAS